jgi:CDP-glycerol glycerophosphotransferase (TagB/SpsB family)
LTCYVPYFFQVTKHLKENFDGFLQNNSWKVFYESDKHFNYAKKYSKNSANNVFVSGYPGLDRFLFNNKPENDPWKIKDRDIKRIIWAPHHTIIGQDSGLALSNFLKYASFFQTLALSEDVNVQIAFKPHPLLKSKLYKDRNWGIDKTDNYFEFWKNCSSGLLVEGDYSDLFLTSDAMIHDSGSFTIEYLATQKPTLFLLQSLNQLDSLNSFGKEAVYFHYNAKCKIEIEDFINEVVIKGNDLRKNERIAFIKRNLMPPNNKTASQNIVDYLLSILN